MIEIPYNKENVIKYKSRDNLLRHARTDKDCTGIMLVSNNKLVGYIGWQGKMIIALEVTESYRGLGYGEYLLKKAISSGCTSLTVDKNNIPAINLYKKLGFHVTLENGKRLTMELLRRKTFSSSRVIENLIFVSPLPRLERELIEPSIPSNFLVRRKYIDHQLPRIQLYQTVGDAISGRYLNETPEPILYVYKAIGLRYESLIKPGLSDCPYGMLVDEYWSLINIKPVYLGAIEVNTKKPKRIETYKVGPRQTVEKLLRWSWKEILKKWEKPNPILQK